MRTGDEPPSNCQQFGTIDGARRDRDLASRVKGAARGWADRTWHFTGHGLACAVRGIDLRDRIDQQPRIRVRRRLEYLFCIADFPRYMIASWSDMWRTTERLWLIRT